MRDLIGRAADRRAVETWSRLADHVGSLDLPALTAARSRAGALRREVDRLCRGADRRLAAAGSENVAIDAPMEADWCWRPDLWRGGERFRGLAAAATGRQLTPDVGLFHDCHVSEISLRQVINRDATDLAPFWLRMDVFRFDGSFLSLAVDLPDTAVDGLKRRHIFGLNTALWMERPLEVFARLNVRHGPNTEQSVHEFPGRNGELKVEFELDFSELNEHQVSKAWVDLIFEGPEMNQVEIRDLALYRCPRAEL